MRKLLPTLCASRNIGSAIWASSLFASRPHHLFSNMVWRAQKPITAIVKEVRRALNVLFWSDLHFDAKVLNWHPFTNNPE
jgi:hypothetical protein